MEGDSLTWNQGPKNTRSIRVLLYVSKGFLGSLGILSGLYVVHVLLTRATSIGINSSTVAIVLLGLFLLVIRGLPFGLAWQSGHFTPEFFSDFADVCSMHLVVVSSLLISGTLLGPLILVPHLRPLYVFLPLVSVGGWMTLTYLAYFLHSEGRIDPETQTLIYRDETVDLDSLADVQSVTVNKRTVLFLSFDPGTGPHPRRFFVLPKSTVNEARPVFKSGIDQNASEGDSTDRMTYVGGAIGLFSTAGGLFAFFWLLGVPTGFAILISAMFAVFGVVLLDAGFHVR